MNGKLPGLYIDPCGSGWTIKRLPEENCLRIYDLSYRCADVINTACKLAAKDEKVYVLHPQDRVYSEVNAKDIPRWCYSS